MPLSPATSHRAAGPWSHFAFWALCCAYFLGLVLFQLDFAKLGVPLSWLSLNTPQSPIELKLYPTEIFLSLLFVGTWWRRDTAWPQLRGSKVFWITAFLFGIGLLRILAELAESPVLVVRNSAFVWYLAFPLILSVLPLDPREMERFAKFLTGVLLVILALAIPVRLWQGFGGAHWITWMGLMAPLWFCYRAPRAWMGWAAAAVLGISLGLDLCFKMQRTTWMGLLLFYSLAPLARPASFRKIYRPLLVIAAAMLLTVGLTALRVHYFPSTIQEEAESGWEAHGPWVKAESRHGLETFRWEMWKDAGEEILEHPLTGVGFRDQVVKRVYVGRGKFVPNTGGFENSSAPPISGPHNSYLNAVARLGVPLGILFLVLHGLAFCSLLRHRLYYSAWLMLGGMAYAFFNVGLEGPTRSFLLLFFVGCAIQAEKRALRQTVPAEKGTHGAVVSLSLPRA